MKKRFAEKKIIGFLWEAVAADKPVRSAPQLRLLASQWLLLALQIGVTGAGEQSAKNFAREARQKSGGLSWALGASGRVLPCLSGRARVLSVTVHLWIQIWKGP